MIIYFILFFLGLNYVFLNFNHNEINKFKKIYITSIMVICNSIKIVIDKCKVTVALT
jgi:hypothetical protein